MKHLATTLQIIGTSMVAMSLGFLHPAAGIGFAGLALVVFGIAAERGS